MRFLQFAVVLSLIGSASAVRAEEVAELDEALAGGWMRAGFGESTKDGTDYVSPTLKFFVEGKSLKMIAGGTPPTVYWNPGPTVHDLLVPKGAKKGELILVVGRQGVKRQIRFEYTIKQDVLTIICKERVPAGPWLGDYNISGRWLRPAKTFADLAKALDVE